MATLANYPNLSQLQAKINPYFDCVPDAIRDGVKYLTGVELDLDVMVTSVYGPNWHGATSAARYVEYCAGWGVRLFPVDGDNAILVARLHSEIQAGHPCLLTEPDVYAPAHPDWSHVLSVYGEAPGFLVARDPYSTRDVTHDDATWEKLLEYREIWSMEALDPMAKPLSITDPPVQSLFEEVSTPAGVVWKSKATGRVLHDALLKDYIANGQYSLDYLGDVMSPEIVQQNGDSVQFYAHGARLWIRATGKVAPFEVFSPVGQDILRKLLAVPAPAPAVPQVSAAALQAAEELANALGKKLV